MMSNSDGVTSSSRLNPKNSLRETHTQSLLRQKIRHRSLSTSRLPRAGSVSTESLTGSMTNLNRTAQPITSQATVRADDRITLNIGGIRYQTNKSTLLKIPGSVLTELSENARRTEVPSLTYEYFFDRSPALFNHILDFYRNSELHFDHNVCPQLLKKELEFWRIPDEALAECCWLRYVDFFEKEGMRDALDRAILYQPPARKPYVLKVGSDTAYISDSELEYGDVSWGVGWIWNIIRQKVFGDRLDRLNLLNLSLRATGRELRLFLILLTFAAILFAAAIFFAESREIIPNIFTGVWWAMVTMTTVGYGGDSHPRSVAGYILGFACSVFGLIIILAILPLLAQKYSIFLGHYHDIKRIRKRLKLVTSTTNSKRN